MFPVLLDQCITIRQRKVRYLFVYFFLSLSPYFTLFTLCFFHVALFSCYTLFFVALSSGCIISMLHLFQCCHFPFCTLHMLLSFHAGLFSCALFSGCTFSVLHFFRLVLFSCCNFLRVAPFL